jgi:hypothetical protein
MRRQWYRIKVPGGLLREPSKAPGTYLPDRRIVMPALARPIDEWPFSVLTARARVLLLHLDPDRLHPPKRSLRLVYWRELAELLKEIDRRGLQGKLF